MPPLSSPFEARPHAAHAGSAARRAVAGARVERRPSALVPAVSRALTLLERLAGAREPMTLARLASELALPKSSVHGLCSTLVSFGYLRRQSDGSFLIGPRVMGLAEAFVSGTDVAQEFNALWADSGAVPEETVVLSVLSGGDALYVGLRTRLTRKGPRDVEALLKELALTRRRGHSVDDEAVREGVCSFGAPVFDSTGAAIAGIAVCINKALLGANR